MMFVDGLFLVCAFIAGVAVASWGLWMEIKRLRRLLKKARGEG